MIDLYTLNDNELAFKEVYNSEYGSLIRHPIYLKELKEILEAHPVMPNTYELVQARRARFMDGPEAIAMNGETPPESIYMNQHERYCYPLIHTHDYIEIIYVYDGECDHIVMDTTTRLKKGDLFILAPNTPHCVLAYDDQNIILNFLVRKSVFNHSFFTFLKDRHVISKFFNDVLYHHSTNPYILFPTGENKDIRQLVYKMYEEFLSNQRFSSRLVNLYFEELMLFVLRGHENDAIVCSPQDMKQNKMIVSLLNYIHINFAHVTVNELAEFFGYTQNYISKVLKEYTGKSFSTMIMELRMERAQQLLTGTSLPLSEISDVVGCFDLSHFNRNFKKYFEISPGQYRKKFQPDQAGGKKHHG